MLPSATVLIVEAIQGCPDGCVVMAKGEMVNQMPVRNNKNNTRLPGGTSRRIAFPTLITLPSLWQLVQSTGRSLERYLLDGARSDRQPAPLPAWTACGRGHFERGPAPAPARSLAGKRLAPEPLAACALRARPLR